MATYQSEGFGSLVTADVMFVELSRFNEQTLLSTPAKSRLSWITVGMVKAREVSHLQLLPVVARGNGTVLGVMVIENRVEVRPATAMT